MEDETCSAHLCSVRHVGVAPHPAVQVCRATFGHANDLVVRRAAEVAPAVGPAGVAVLLVECLRRGYRGNGTKREAGGTWVMRSDMRGQHCNMQHGPRHEKRIRRAGRRFMPSRW